MIFTSTRVKVEGKGSILYLIPSAVRAIFGEFNSVLLTVSLLDNCTVLISFSFLWFNIWDG